MKHPLAQFLYCPECGSPHFEVNNEKSKKCTDCGFVYYFNPSSATVALILNEKKELLVCRRAKEPAKGTLDLPGGFIDMNETGEEGVGREVWEETGLHLTQIQGEENSHSLNIVGNQTISISPFCITQNLSGAYSLLLHTFLCTAEGTLLEQTDETTNIRWMERNTLKKIVDNSPELIFPLHVQALRKYLNQI